MHGPGWKQGGDIEGLRVQAPGPIVLGPLGICPEPGVTLLHSLKAWEVADLVTLGDEAQWQGIWGFTTPSQRHTLTHRGTHINRRIQA